MPDTEYLFADCSSDYGECEIAVPRDRNGEFKPQIIEKRQTRTGEIEDKILAMYAKGKILRTWSFSDWSEKNG